MKTVRVYITVAVMLFCLVAPQLVAEKEGERPLRLNVFAVVSENIETEFMKAAHLLKDEYGIDSFPLEGLQIHCTMFMTDYPHAVKDELVEKVKEFAASTQQFHIETSGLEITSGNWFFLNFANTPDLQKAADTLVTLLSNLRAPSDYIPRWAENYPRKVEYIGKFGSPNVFEEFNPHLTFLARGDEEKLKHFMKTYSDKPFARKIDGKVVAIGIGEADRNGQIPEVMHLFHLKANETSE